MATSKNSSKDGRVFQSVLTAIARRHDERIDLLSPAVGLWRHGPRPGELVGPGEDLGELEILGELHRLVAPDDVAGAVVEDPTRAKAAPVAVDYKAPLVQLDPKATPSGIAAVRTEAVVTGGLLFRAPLSGRFYGRANPSQPPFVRAGDVVSHGQTVALLEVMKTFNRVVYGGAGLPAQAKIKRVIPADESDIEEGDPVLELEDDTATESP